MANFQRESFYSKVTVDDGSQQLDLLMFSWLRFSDTISSSSVIRHTVSQHEEARLDYISYKYYGTVDFWWLLAITNQISDPILEVVSGMILAIPSITDIEAFYQSIKSNNRAGTVASLPSNNI